MSQRDITQEGALVAELIIAGLNALNLTTEQRIQAMRAVHSKLLVIAGTVNGN